MKNIIILWIIISILLIIFVYLLQIYKTNNEALVSSINYSYRNDFQGYVAYEDYWHKPIYVEFEERTDKMVRIKATSAGSDREFGTKDDIQMIDTFYNYPKIIGNKIGQIGKQALEGYVEGLKQKSIFDKKE